MAGDPYWNNVVLAMHMDDVGLSDLKGHAITLNGNATRSATQSKFGGYSAYFDGAGDYLSAGSNAAFAFGASDFTIECWVRFADVSAAGVIYDGRNLTQTSGVALYRSAAAKLTFYTSSADRIVGTSSIAASTWYHVAICKSGGSTKLFLSGVQDGSTYSDSNNYTDTLVTIGADRAGSSMYMNGYIDGLRITKGVARYTADFAPPNRAFPDRLYTSLSGTVQDSYGAHAERLIKSYRMSDGLLAGVAASDATTGEFTVDAEGAGKHFVVCQENYDPHYANVALDMRMDDVGLTDQKGHTVTAYASAARSSLASRFGGYSAKFNGTTDYLGVATSTDFDFGSGDFTIEAWVAIAVEKAVDDFHAITALGWNNVAANSYAFFLGLVNGSTGGRELRLYLSQGGTVSGLAQATCPAGWALGEFAHVAVVRSGAMLRAYFNGVGGSPMVSPASVFAPTAQPLYIGNGHPANTEHHYLNGYIDSLRITKGVARYTQDFIPQPLPFASQTAPVENALIFDNITPI